MGDGTVEGLQFPVWFARQFALDSNVVPGLHVLNEPLPITSGLAGPDFGVFLIQATLFTTDTNGNETLSSGTCYPIFSEPGFLRLTFSNSAENKIDIAGGYGGVAPNFPDLFATQPYRVAVDLPVLDQIERVYVPAGAIATASSSAPNDLYGTVVGAPLDAGQSLVVRVSFGATTLADIPVMNATFGTLVGSSAFLGYNLLDVQLIRVAGATETVILDRVVAKGPGPLALDLDTPDDLLLAREAAGPG